METISVIVPIFRVEKYLKKCVRSILDQSYRKLEIILVDDGSPDGCPALCDAYAAEDERVQVIHQQNGGLSAARNAGLDRATGEWVIFPDADDWLDRDALERMLKAATEAEADLAVCNLLYEYEDGSPSEVPDALGSEVISGDEALKRLCVLGNVQYVPAANRLYRTSLWRTLRFPRGRYHEDEYVAHVIYGNSRRVALMQEPLYHYLQRGNSITKADPGIKILDRAEPFYERCVYLRQRNDKDLWQHSFRRFMHYYLSAMMAYTPRNRAEKERFAQLREKAQLLLRDPWADGIHSGREALAVNRPGLWRTLHDIRKGGKKE